MTYEQKLFIQQMNYQITMLQERRRELLSEVDDIEETLEWLHKSKQEKGDQIENLS